MADEVHVVGLPEFKHELSKLVDETRLNKGLEDARAQVADLIVGRARSNASRPVQRKAADSLYASGSEISYGGPGYPFAMGAEFGALQYRQFPPFLGRTGYFLYPAVRDSVDDAQRIYLDAFDDMVHKAFPD